MPILRCKVAIVGDCKVGKTALTSVFHKGKAYQKNYVMTLGVDFAVKTVKIPDSSTSVELYLFDTSGSPLYSAIRSNYWNNTNLIMACYDITNRESFNNIKTWIDQVSKQLQPNLHAQNSSHRSLRSSSSHPHVSGILVATKLDLKEFASVTSAEGRELAGELNFVYFEVSSLSGKDVDTPFNFLANQYHLEYEELEREIEQEEGNQQEQE